MNLKIKSRNLLYILALSAFLFSACKGPDGDSGPAGPKGDQGPKLTGSVSGFIALRNAGETSLPASSEAAVSVEGTGIKVNCDSTGKWIIDSLETGTYNLVFQLEGFGTYIKKGFQYVGGADLFYGKVTLSQIPSHHVQSLTAVYDYGQQNVTLNGYLSEAPQNNEYFFVIVFAGTDTSVSSDPQNYLIARINATNERAFTVQMLGSEMINAGINKGSKVFFRSYGCTAAAYGSPEGGIYIDPETGNTVYASLSLQRSPVCSLTMP